MFIESGTEGWPENSRRITKPDTEDDISPQLREHITEAAKKISADHNAELANVLKADGAVRLFRSIIHPNGLEHPSAIPGEATGSLAAEFGALLSDAVRTGTELLAGPLTALAQGWVTTMIGPANSNSETLADEAPVPGDTTQSPPSVAPSRTADVAGCGATVPEIPGMSPEEVRLQGLFRRFMPMLVFSLTHGGTGYELAEKVITLFGRRTYEQASGIGKERIMAILKSEPGLWAQVAAIEARFSRFLDEFLGYDAWVEKPSTVQL